MVAKTEFTTTMSLKVQDKNCQISINGIQKKRF